jgi:hypothetical protein
MTMTGQSNIIDVRAGMAWAIMAPALAGAIIGLAGGPGFAIAVFMAALSIAGMHVVVLALPLYGLLRLIGRQPGPGIALVAAILIGAVPAGLRFGVVVGFLGGLFGLIGGGAFCAASMIRVKRNESR